MDNFNLRSRFALLLLVLIAPLAGVSAAGLIDLNSDYPSANANAAASAGVAGSVSSVKKTADIQANVNANVNASATDTSRSSVRGSASSSATVTPGRAGGVDVTAGNSGTIIHVDRSSLGTGGNTTVTMTSDRVSTEADLKDFASTELRGDENLSSMDLASDHVALSYRVPARLLGIIPTSVNVNVNVQDDGTVDVGYPWYSFLMLTNRDELDAAVRNEVGAYMSQHNASATGIANSNAASALHASTTATSTATTTTSSSGNGLGWSAQFRAALAARIEAILRARIEAGAAATSTVTR